MDPALYKAATQGKVAGLNQLVDPEDPSILSSTTPQLNTALHLAATHGHAAFAGEVLDKDEELLVARNDDGDTPLHRPRWASWRWRSCSSAAPSPGRRTRRIPWS
jgi:ankyrin repeat protein